MTKRAEVLAAAAAFVERVRDEEREAAVERVCASAAPGMGPFRSVFMDDHYVECIRNWNERSERVDLFSVESASTDNRCYNRARFPDLYDPDGLLR